MQSWINFKELRAKLLFSEVLTHYRVETKVKGDRATACCPLPGHPRRTDTAPRTASLSVNLARNIFQCFGCKASGNALEFACRMEGFDPADSQQFRSGAIRVAEVFGIDAGTRNEGLPPSDESKPDRSPRPPQTAPPKSASSAGPAPIVNAPLDFQLKDLDPEHPYLRDRDILPQTIEHFGLGYCNRGMLKGRFAIPLHDIDGRLVGYAGRITKDSMISDECPKYLFPGNRERDGKVYEFRKSHLLYNAHRIVAPVDHIFVVEGFPATWWLWQSEYRTTVGLMGSHCSDKQAERIVSLVKPSGKVWLMPDGNDAGIQCARSCFEKIAPHRFVRWVRLQAHEQPTDLLESDLATAFE
jgi:DNA primase